MTETQYQMLRKFGQFARNLRFFTSTTTSIGDVVMCATTAQSNLNSLMAQGLIYPIKGDTYRITEAGRNLLDMKGKDQAAYDRLNNRTAHGHYQPPRWAVREGGNDHLAIPSRGMI